MTQPSIPLALAISALVTMGAPAMAETKAPVARQAAEKVNPARVTPNAAAGQLKPRADLLTVKPLKVQPFTFVVNFPIVPADMTGWSARTVGATKGGGTLVQGEGRALLIARGADDYLYVTPIDPAGQGQVASSAWAALSDKSASEPACVDYRSTWQGKTHNNIVCAFLGTAGNARYRFLGDDGTKVGSSFEMDMGGKNAGAAPTLLRKPKINDGGFGSSHEYEFGVWDGQSGLFTRTVGWFIAPGAGNAIGLTDWKKLQTPFTSAPGCADSICVTHDGARARIVELKGDGSEPVEKATSPNLAGGLTGKPAVVALPNNTYAVVVRGLGGAVYQIFYNSKTNAFSTAWKSEGGFIAKGATPSCIAVNVQPVCIIQGNDGRLYSKGLASSGGL